MRNPFGWPPIATSAGYWPLLRSQIDKQDFDVLQRRPGWLHLHIDFRLNPDGKGLANSAAEAIWRLRKFTFGNVDPTTTRPIDKWDLVSESGLGTGRDS